MPGMLWIREFNSFLNATDPWGLKGTWELLLLGADEKTGSDLPRVTKPVV